MEYYELRVHTNTDFDSFWDSLTLITSLPVKEYQPTTAILMSYETDANRPHYQGIIYTDISQSTLRKRLVNTFRLQGNTDYSLTTVKKLESALSYTLKEGNYRFTDNFETLVRPIEDIQPWSEATIDFDDQLKEIDKQYLESSMSDDLYLDRILTLYSTSGRKALQLHHIRSHWLALFNRRNRLSVRRISTYNGYEEVQYSPRQLLIDSLKNFIIH